MNHAVWLQKMWLATVFLLLCGDALFAIPLGGVHITAGIMSLAFFLYLFVLTLMLHQGRADVRIKVGSYVLFFGVWLLWAVFSLFWVHPTISTGRHMMGIILGTGIILFSLLFLSNDKGIKNIHYLWVISAAIFVGIAICEIATGMHLAGSAEAHGWAPTAVFYNRNDFATFLCLAMPFMFGMLQLIRSTLPRVVVSILLVLSLCLIVMVDSRANVIASLIGAGLLLLLPGAKSRLSPIATVLGAAAIVFLSAYVLFPSAMTHSLQLLLTAPQQITSIGAGEVSTSVRIALVKNGWAFLQQSHYLGVGVGGFEYWMTERPLFFAAGIVNPHNWWLEILVDYGVAIFGLFLTLYLGLLWNLFRVFRNSENQASKAVSLATFIALVELNVAGTSSSSLMTAWFVWLLFATALCVLNNHRVTEHDKRGDRHLVARRLASAEAPNHV